MLPSAETISADWIAAVRGSDSEKIDHRDDPPTDIDHAGQRGVAATGQRQGRAMFGDALHALDIDAIKPCADLEGQKLSGPFRGEGRLGRDRHRGRKRRKRAALGMGQQFGDRPIGASGRERGRHRLGFVSGQGDDVVINMVQRLNRDICEHRHGR